MKHIKRLPAVLVPIALVALGATAILAGVYMLVGLAPALLVGGIAAVAAGLLVDVA